MFVSWQVHQNKSNILVCRICEKDVDSQSTLRQHMRQHHAACEMPYICQLCNFRSSIYSDVVDHFKKVWLGHLTPTSLSFDSARPVWYFDPLKSDLLHASQGGVIDLLQRHDSSQYVLCLYCLKVFKISLSKSAGWGLTQNYYNHLQV